MTVTANNLTSSARKARGSNFPKRVGAIRPSQILHTYGVGSLIDLPNFSVIVSGLQAWNQPVEYINEPRLLRAVQAELGPQVEHLAAMPWIEGNDDPFADWARVGIPVIPFPRWLRCTRCNILSTIDGELFELKPSPYRIERTYYAHTSCLLAKGKAPIAVPARFVLACTNGHLDEFPWQEFAHNFNPCPKGGGVLKLSESGSGTRSTEMFVHCEACKQSSVVSKAFDPRADQGPKCRGRHPHLREFEECNQIAQPLLLGASNTWFGILRSALALPPDTHRTKIDDEVEAMWKDLSDPAIDSEASLTMAIKFNPSLRRLNAILVDELWAAIERRRNPGRGEEGPATNLKAPEWDYFIDPDNAPKSLDFTIDDAGVPRAYATQIAQVVAATRLRESSALIGFARIEAPESGIAKDAEKHHRVPLSTENPRWVPANDARGEGIFVRLPEHMVRAWEGNAEKHERIRELKESVLRRGGEWPGARYVLLHSLAHLLINELSLECGYNAASLRERIYSDTGGGGEDPMAGLLIYTSAADSEGTLGGLVAMAKTSTFTRVLKTALDRANLCSSDPLCAEHQPTRDDGTQHGASCHSCLFVPETSCEVNNRLLDRAALVETLTASGVAYFG